MKIILVSNGIFPLTRDKDGKALDRSPATGFDMPGTIQGEGKLSGIPVLFIRTSGCNLRCVWQTAAGEISVCDTSYASHMADEHEEWEIRDIIATLRHNLGNIRHVVLSGGEPTMQPLALTALAKSIKQELKLHVTLETNGVTYVQQLAEYIDLFSVSPKLKSSEPDRKKNKLIIHPVDPDQIRYHRENRRKIKTIQRYINACMNFRSYYDDKPDAEAKRRPDKDFQLKFVVASEADIPEIRRDFLDHLNFVENEDVLLMPVGENREMLRKTSLMASRLAIQNGWRYAPRLQIDLFDDRRDV